LSSKVIEFIKAYCLAKKYGKIVLHVEAGVITRIVTEESIKL